MAGSTISIQAIAYALDGLNIDQEVKWQIVTFPINDSLNLVESGEIPPSITNQWEIRIDAVEQRLDRIEELLGIV